MNLNVEHWKDVEFDIPKQLFELNKNSPIQSIRLHTSDLDTLIRNVKVIGMQGEADTIHKFENAQKVILRALPWINFLIDDSMTPGTVAVE